MSTYIEHVGLALVNIADVRNMDMACASAGY